MPNILKGFSFFTGASYPLRSLKVFAQNPRLLTYLGLPMLINAILGVILYTYVIKSGWRISQQMTQVVVNWVNAQIANFPAWLGFLDNIVGFITILIGIIVIIIMLLLTGIVLVQFGVIIGAPWYGKLSEKLEELRTGKVEVIEVGIIKDVLRALLFELKKLSLLISVGIILFLVNFIPVLGTIVSSIGWITLTATIVCLDFFDSTLERRRLPFRRKIKIVWGSLPASAGFSLVCLGLISIPLVNLVTIPICVASGTLFVCDRVLGNGQLTMDN